MDIADRNHAVIVKKMEGLTPDMIQEIIDFIDFLKSKKSEDGFGNKSSLLVQQESLNRIWETESEDLYE